MAPKPEAERPTLAELEATGPGETPSLAAASRLLVEVSQGRYHEAYGMLHSKLRATVSEDEVTRSLELIEKTYGKPTSAVPKQQALVRMDSRQFGTMTVRRLTFALGTTLHPPGTHFAVVELAVDGEAVAPLTYQVMTFVGDIPADLK